jgi:hypothetical protein
MVYAKFVNMLGGNVHSVVENTEALVVAIIEIVLEVNADKTGHVRRSECRTKLLCEG